MSQADELRTFYKANIACGDICEGAAAKMRAEIAAAETKDDYAFSQTVDQQIV